MDAIGFALATAFLATVFTIFGIIGRILDGVADGVRYTVAPAMISGFTAWTARRAAPSGTRSSGGASKDDATGSTEERGDDEGTGLVVPVQGLVGQGRQHAR
jgi:hypothetical protein